MNLTMMAIYEICLNGYWLLYDFDEWPHYHFCPRFWNNVWKNKEKGFIERDRLNRFIQKYKRV